MSERTRHTKPIPFPITKLTCSNKHEKVVSTTAKTVTLNQKKGKNCNNWKQHTTQTQTKHKQKHTTLGFGSCSKRSSRFRSSTTHHNRNFLWQIYHNPRQILTNLTDPFPIIIHLHRSLPLPTAASSILHARLFLFFLTPRVRVLNADPDCNEMDVNLGGAGAVTA